jgi:LacI family transcriptional regulator
MGYDFILDEESRSFAFVVTKHFFLETDAFSSDMYYQFNKQCLERGVGTALIIVGNSELAQNTLPPQMQMEEFSGVAAAGEMPDAFLRLLEKPGRPLALMDFESSAVSACSLLTDNYHWASVITQLLVDQGHQKIGFIGQPGATKSITDRYFGYRRTLLLNHLPFQEEWVLVNNDTLTGLYTSNIALPQELPTAFVCHCDMAAYYLLGTLNQHGLKCPRDVSIISFDNTRLAETCCPPLTSVGIDTKAFARKALELLTHPELREGNRRIYLPAALIERKSNGPAKTIGPNK